MLDKLIDVLQKRIEFHESAIVAMKSYGDEFHDDIKISEGQIMEAREIMSLLFVLEGEKGNEKHK